MKTQKRKNNILNVHKNHPKGIDVKSDQDDTHLIYNTASIHPPPYKKNNPGHHALDPNHIPNTDDSAFAQ